jgi:phosphoglucosamine mutase
VLLRPSGTEPLVRVMVEGEDAEQVNEEADNLASIVAEAV